MQQIALDIGLVPAPTFDNYFPGPNGATVAQLRMWLQPQGAAVSPLTAYLWGPQGSGKSHLLEAACDQWRAQGRPVGRLDARTDEARMFDERWAVVVMDDVDLYSPAQQHTAFSWFVQAHTLQRPVLAAGLLAPQQLTLREDLRTRLAWGHVLGLDLLSEVDTRVALRQAADARGLALSEEVMDFTLRRFSRDLGSLMQLLDTLDRYALQTQRALTIPLVKSMLENA
ncbi:MAG: DnaA regulatory inactivator Hda [Rhodoferax sp.]